MASEHHALARRDAILRTVSFAASGFLRTREWNSSADALLRELGAATGVHRIYVFQNGNNADGELTGSQRFEWVADGIEPQIDNPALQNLPYEAGGFGRWARVLAEGQVIASPVSDLPADEAEFLAAQGIQSLAVVPIYAGDEWWGFMGFDDCATERAWSDGEVEALRAAAGALGAAVHRTRTEDALRQSEAQLRQAQKMEAVGMLAGGVAHDFNNLLTVIQGSLEVLLETDPGSATWRADVEEARRAAQRAAQLTRQLLAFSRRQLMAPQPVSVNDAVNGMLPMLRRLIGEDIEITSDLHPGAGHALVDPGQLEQVLLNLVVNARDAMPQGGRVTIAARKAETTPDLPAGAGRPDGPWVEIAVRDTGTGMDPETQARVFEPFFTTKGAGRGTGLGLSTVYGIIKQSQGFIYCRSAPGAGTTFTVLLRPTDAPAHSPADRERPVKGVGTGTVLLVEDEDGVRRIAQRALARGGFTVLEASSGEEALALAAGHPAIDLVITDLVMPGMTGWELVDQLRSITPHQRVLFVSGYAEEDIRRRGRALQEQEILEKPFTPTGLVTAVRRALED